MTLSLQNVKDSKYLGREFLRQISSVAHAHRKCIVKKIIWGHMPLVPQRMVRYLLPHPLSPRRWKLYLDLNIGDRDHLTFLDLPQAVLKDKNFL